MLLVILIIIIVVAVSYGLRSRSELNLNEKLYLRRRGYQATNESIERAPVSKDLKLLGAIESLSDVSPYARQRAAEDLSRICAAGNRDDRMLSPLIEALNDNDASVRSAVATALGNYGDLSSREALNTRLGVEESIHVRASIERALQRMG
jgi:HEAT repeat protein